ncbi:flagellin [Cryobacterium sp. Y50]|uniref:flagellin N-terminal helical domain-containing protein n=1 Tax=Cryobacterium sp. Y50 TaxID=2048286 RepID=UPI000CE2C46A
MGMQVNTNIAANNAYRNLATTQNDLSKSLEKLSSGLRINRAADDAAGLAISEGLKSQVGGLTVAARNAQDAVSVLQTAEGSLNEVQSILQRVRDLAVQAGNDSNNEESRAAIQTEVTALSKELTRISESTNFNGTQLLDGSKSVLSFQIGANAEASSRIEVGLGKSNVATVASAIGGGTNVEAVTTIADGAVQLSGVDFDATTVTGDVNIKQAGGQDFTVSFGAADGTRTDADVLAKLQSAAAATGGKFTVTADATDASKYTIQSQDASLVSSTTNAITVSTTSAGTVSTSGVAIDRATVAGIVTITQANGATISHNFGEATSTLTDDQIVTEFNTDSSNNGKFTVSKGATAGQFTIASANTSLTDPKTDGITVSGNNAGAVSTKGESYTYTSGKALQFVQAGGDTGTFTLTAAENNITNLVSALNLATTFNASFTASDVSGVLTITSKASGLNNAVDNKITVSEDAVASITGTSTASSTAFSAAGTAVGSTGPEVDSTGVTAGANVYEQVSTTANVTTVVAALDFSSAASAALALTEIDAQITQVSSARAELGANQNRFESVIRNLAVSKENLTAAGSRIRDTDMAEEMVKYTRANILSQAGTAMLAQANQSNSGVLQLLQ